MPIQRASGSNIAKIAAIQAGSKPVAQNCKVFIKFPFQFSSRSVCQSGTFANGKKLTDLCSQYLSEQVAALT